MQKMCLSNWKCRNSPLWLLLIGCYQQGPATDHREKTTVSLYFLKICKFANAWPRTVYIQSSHELKNLHTTSFPQHENQKFSDTKALSQFKRGLWYIFLCQHRKDMNCHKFPSFIIIVGFVPYFAISYNSKSHSCFEIDIICSRYMLR